MLELKDISKSYVTDSYTNHVLDNISTTFRDSEFVSILGASGSGKTTLLNILGGLDHADSGELIINGVSTKNYTDSDWDTYRNHHVGFIFQSYNLIPHQSVLSNVELALTLTGIPKQERIKRATEALTKVGLADHINKKPSQLSGGQAQRVAIARAIVCDPDIILADEPTGALDTQTGIQVMDILKEISNNRLVIMVTHNPDLAHEYSTRIISLADGHITGDTNPFVASEKGEELAAASVVAPANRKASMSFLTALALSFNNLMTKKGRTFLTAFAGSIGIIGIAAILALSNGVNNYIVKTEQDSMSKMPITINSEEADQSKIQQAAEEQNEKNKQDLTKDPSETSDIPQTNSIAEMFSKTDAVTKKNDLAAFKQYLDSPDCPIKNKVNAIKYNYNVTPLFLSADPNSETPVLGQTLNSGSLNSAIMSHMSGPVAAFSFASGTQNPNGFQEMFGNLEVVKNQYDLVAGKWAEGENEAVLVLDKNGSISNYTLFGLGVLNNKEVIDYAKAASEKNAKQPELPKVNFTYEDALKLKFKAAPLSASFKQGTKANTWESALKDTSFMQHVAKDGIDVQVVGVIRPNAATDSVSLSQGIAYSPKLKDKIIELANQSSIVKYQLAHPDYDVFSGMSFKQAKEATEKGFEPENLMSLNKKALSPSAGLNPDMFKNILSGLSPEALMQIDPSELELDPKELSISADTIAKAINKDTVTSLIKNAPLPNMQKLDLSGMTNQQKQDITAEVNRLAGGFITWYMANYGPMTKVENVTDAIKAYLETTPAKQSLAQIEALLGPDTKAKIETFFSTYIKDELTPYLMKSAQTIFSAVETSIAQQLQATMQKQMAKLSGTISQQIGSKLQEAMTAYAQTMAEAMAANMASLSEGLNLTLPATNLSNLMSGIGGAGADLESNLQRMGYADPAKPASISLYPKSFEDKEAILKDIDAYNQEMDKKGEPEKAITYFDFMAQIISSITTIVNMVSLVLIAFVSISLVVSSIMIGIITYISVLERKKEIGILRAMGASKRNIANVFNAETVIEGAIAGIFAILIVLGISQIVNVIVWNLHKIPNIMSLPFSSALLLIAISIGLTLIAGLIPSSKAAREDPVQALRSE